MKMTNLLTLLTCLTTLLDKKHRLVIKYLKEENLILCEQLHDKYKVKRIILTDSQRKRLAARAKPLGRKLLGDTTDLFCPSTILGWYCKLIAKKYDGAQNRRCGRPKITKEKIDLVIRFAKDNPGWSYGRICNYMAYLGFEISKSSVKRIMQDYGFNPDPKFRSKGNWNRFIRSHFDVLCATDFFSYELLTPKGLVRCMVLFVIELSTRKVHIAGIKTNPDGNWTKQIARNLTDFEDGFLRGKKYFIHDRDTLFTKEIDDTIEAAGVKVIKTPKQSPNLNAYAEKFVQNIKTKALNHLILTNQKQLEYAINSYLEWYHHERPHEGLDGKMIDP